MVETMSDTALQEIELSIKEAQKFVELGNALVRLQSNQDFKKIILEGYFKEEAIRLVHLKSDSNMQSAERQQGILRDMDAIGALEQHLRMVLHRADMARKAIVDAEELRDELLTEESA